MYKAPQPGSAFGSLDVEKVHAVVAQSTFRSQKCTKQTILRPLLEVDMSKKCMPLWREAHFQIKVQKAHQPRSTFGSWDVEKSARRCGMKHISKSKCTKHHMLGPLLKFKMWFCVAGARDSAPCQKWAKHAGFVARPKTMAGIEHLKRICKDAFSVAGAVQETCLSEMLGGPGADFLRWVAFWSIRSSGLLKWCCMAGAALRMTWHQFFRGSRCITVET